MNRDQPVGEIGISIGDPARLELVEPLWAALQQHQTRITPALAGIAPKRPLDESWRRRRAKYERWLSQPDTFFLLARDGELPVGYAFVTVNLGHATWAGHDRLAELETLSVLPAYRGHGVGGALMKAVWRELARRGLRDLSVTTTTTNADAHYFYRAHGLEPSFVIFYGRAPGGVRDTHEGGRDG